MKKEKKNVSLHHHKKAAPDTKKYNQSVNRALQQKLWPEQNDGIKKAFACLCLFWVFCAVASGLTEATQTRSTDQQVISKKPRKVPQH